MESRIKTETLKISGMTCISCQNRIEKALRNTAGIKSVTVSYETGTAEISFDPDLLTMKDISSIIESLGYEALADRSRGGRSFVRSGGLLLVIVSLYMLLQHFGILNLLAPGQLADSGTGYGMLFVIGVITSVHCVAMCGGINISQCISKTAVQPPKQSRFSAFVPALLYNLGRVISYTVIGFCLGLTGFIIGGSGSEAGLPVMLQGILKMIAGIFMVIMGINMLDLFPALRKRIPHLPQSIRSKVDTDKVRSKGPFVVGLLNGLMPCGPLQSMQIVALASGNPFVGALSMLLFSLGTVPLMLGLGSAVSALGQKFTKKVMTAGAVLVVVLGLSMLSQGGSLSGFMPSRLLAAGSAKTSSDVDKEDGRLVITSTLSGRGYPNITVEAGKPVKWIINAPEGSINGCNARLNIPEYGIENYTLETGENVIEFTPDQTGTFGYSCWMGMIRGKITVVDDLNNVTQAEKEAADSAAANSTTSDSATSESGSICGCCGQ